LQTVNSIRRNSRKINTNGSHDSFPKVEPRAALAITAADKSVRATGVRDGRGARRRFARSRLMTEQRYQDDYGQWHAEEQ
jgi:hypothetical protein